MVGYNLAAAMKLLGRTHQDRKSLLVGGDDWQAMDVTPTITMDRGASQILFKHVAAGSETAPSVKINKTV
jgi:hypothetical protein